MRAEHKVGLIVGVFVVAGGAIWWFSRPTEQLAELPLDDRQALEARSGADLRLAADAEPAAAAGRQAAKRSSERAGPAPALPQRRATAVPAADRPGETAPAQPIAAGPTPSGAEVRPTPLTPAVQQPTGQPTGAVAPGEGGAGATPALVPPAARERTTPPARPARQTPAPARRPGRKTYVIQPGDRLIDIAREEYGDWRLWEAIKAANPGIDENRLQIGQRIELPSREQAVRLVPASEPQPTPAKRPGAQAGRASYIVGPGDTLIKIARNVLKDASRWEEIYELNRDRLESPDLLRVGMELRLPPLEKQEKSQD